MKKLDLVKTLLLSCDDWVTIEYLLKVCHIILNKLFQCIHYPRLIVKILQHLGVVLVVLMDHLQR